MWCSCEAGRGPSNASILDSRRFTTTSEAVSLSSTCPHGLTSLTGSLAWSGGRLALDLPGHGRSDRASSYAFDAQADLVGEALPAGRDVVLLGHSMGGMVALALAASRPGVRRVIGLSIKTWWPAEQVEGMRAQSLKPARIFPTREQAVERYLMAAGLRGVADRPRSTAR